MKVNYVRHRLWGETCVGEYTRSIGTSAALTAVRSTATDVDVVLAGNCWTFAPVIAEDCGKEKRKCYA
jgi:hypothetical protein